MKMYLVCAVLLIIFTQTREERILLLGINSHSHQIEVLSVGHELARRGHEVFNALPDNGRSNMADGNLKVLPYRVTNKEPMLQMSTVYEKNLSEMVFNKTDPITIGHWILSQSQEQCKFMLDDAEFLTNIKSMNFDIVLVDAFILDYCLFIIPSKLSLPYIAISGTLLNYWSMGIPALPSISPGTVLNIAPAQTFLQRLFSLLEHSFINSYFFPMKSNKVTLHHAPTYYSHRERFLQEAKLFIITFDHHLEFPGPSMPDTIFLPGITYIPPQPLSQRLEQAINQSTKAGIVLVSFGSNLSGHMPLVYFQKLMKAFTQFPQYLILWKYPKHAAKNLSSEIPTNILLESWFEQNDILGHSQTKLFITHCGNNGQYEALHNGVPMIGLPLFAEQAHNAYRMEQRGYGISLNLHTMTTKDFVSAMDEILHRNPNYSQKVQTIASILSRFPPPRETAASWVEEVMLYGNDHLRSPARDMSIVEFLSIDLYLTVLITMVFLLYCTFVVTRKCLAMCVSIPQYLNSIKLKQG